MIVQKHHIYKIMKLSDWNQHRVIGTNLDSVDERVQFREINTPTLKTYFLFQLEITEKDL